MANGYGDTVGKFFTKYRERGGLSQADLGRLLRVTPQYICNVESGRNMRPVRLAQRLMKFLDAKAQSVLDDLMREAVYDHADLRIRQGRLLEKTKDGRSKHGASR